MNNINSANMIEQEFITRREKFLEQLAAYTLIDIGTISNAGITKNGYRCDVYTFRLQTSQRVTYTGVEILMPGNGAGGINIEPNGATCIVLCTYSTPVSSSEKAINEITPPYDPRNLKCIPIGNAYSWVSGLRIESNGNLTLYSPNAFLRLRIDGSLIFDQTDLQQVLIHNDGSIDIFNNQRREYHKADGSYYRYIKGVEPGSFTLFESFLNNVKDIFITSIDNFEWEDGDTSEWEQMMNHNSWRRHEQHNYNTGVRFIAQYDEDGNLVSEETFNPDGSRLLSNIDSNGNNLFNRLIDGDGAISMEIGDGAYTLTIEADGTVTEHQSGPKAIDSDGAIDIMANGADLVTIGNAVSTLGALFAQLCDALSAHHSEGSPAAHTSSAWAAAMITPLKQLAGQVLG